MNRAAIGIGANLGDPVRTVRRAARELERHGRVVARSALYGSRAWGVRDQPDFVNAVALLETRLEPHALLRALKAIERALGRVPTYRWGPRVVDLDILTFGARTIADASLRVPHERLFERAFALAPLAEVDARYADALAALPRAQRASVWRIPLAAERSRPIVEWGETLARVRTAADFAARAGLARFAVEEADLAIEIVRTAPPAGPGALGGDALPETVPATNGTMPSSNGQNGASGGARGVQTTTVRAEFVGVLRFSRPAVSEGAVLPAARELAYVESLGIRNPVRGGPGRVARVYVGDGDAVEYGLPLFALEPPE